MSNISNGNGNGNGYSKDQTIFANGNKNGKERLQFLFDSPQSESVASQEKNLDIATLLLIFKHRFPQALMGFVAVILGAVLYLMFAPRLYKVNASIILEDSEESISELGKNLSNNISGSNEYSPLATQSELIASIPVIETALENVNQKQEGELSEDISATDIQNQLKIEILPNTNILEVSYVNSDPEFASLLMNEIITAIIEKNTDFVRSEARSVRQFLEKEVEAKRQELTEAETLESRYRKDNKLVDIQTQTVSLVEKLNTLETEEQTLLTDIEEQETKVDRLQQIAKVNSADLAYTAGKIGQNPQLEKLRSQLTNVEVELAAARSKFTNEHPLVVTLVQQREELRNLYQTQISNVLGEETTVAPSVMMGNALSGTERGLGQEVFSELITNQIQLEADREKFKAIQNQKENIQNQIALLPDKAQSLKELVRQREQANESLQFLQRKLEEARIAEAQLVSKIHIIERASVPSSTHSPKIPVVLAIATAVGSILAASIVLLLETTDRTLYSGTTVERRLQIPFLTALPKLPNGSETLGEMQAFLENGALYEPYRRLLKQLESSSYKRLKVVVVTSAIAQEGKSLVASHLGAVAAMLSKKTLIIDGHLLQPKQHNWFDLEVQPGLTDTVTDKFSLSKAVQSTDIENLSVLASGISTANSCMVMESPAMETIIQEASMEYDFVIIDTSPATASYDAYTLDKYSDGLLLVTQPLYTPLNLLEETVAELKKNRTSIIGFVTNNTDEKQQPLTRDRAQSSALVSLNHN